MRYSVSISSENIVAAIVGAYIFALVVLHAVIPCVLSRRDWFAVRRAVFDIDEHIVSSAVFAHLDSEQVAVHVKRRWFPLWFDGEINKLRQFHHLAAVEGYLFGMVDYTVASHPAVLVLPETDVYAKLCLENINESLYALAVLLA